MIRHSLFNISNFKIFNKYKPAFCRLFLLLVIYTQVHASVSYYNEKHFKKSFLDFSLIAYEYDYKVEFNVGLSKDQVNYGHALYIGFEAQMDSIFNYALVNFVTGCAYSQRGDDISFNRMIYSFEEVIPIKFQTMIIDSGDTDPVFASDINLRHSKYRWEKSRRFRGDWKYVSEQEPRDNFLFTYINPGSVTSDGSRFENMSLFYETCIFNTDEIPMRTKRSDISFKSRALYCYKWKSSFVYNDKLARYESPDDIDTICLE